MTIPVLMLAAPFFVECESFDDLGGWTVDPSSMGEMGSSYVMAHGYGVPVADAKTSVAVKESDAYTVWARTRNWAAEWTAAAPGRFEVRVNGASLGEALGTEGRDWHWQKAGTVRLRAGQNEIALHDLTGFNGTLHAGEIKSYIQLCLAISHKALTAASASPRRTNTDNPAYTFRCWLLQLGLIGEEFKTARNHLLKNLPGNAAWRHGNPTDRRDGGHSEDHRGE